jgi:hypothetical protein
MFAKSEFGPVGLLITKRKVIVAVNTGKVAPPGDLDRAADWDSLRHDALVQFEAPVLVALGFHASIWYHTTRLRAKIPRKTTRITKTRKLENTKKVPLVFLRAFLLSCFRDEAFLLGSDAVSAEFGIRRAGNSALVAEFQVR